jgi:hypothetical protein
MENELLSAEELCTHYNVEYHFLELLQEHDLIEIINVDEQHYLHADTLSNLESLMRMHYDLNINLEGIEVINNLLSRVNNLHEQIKYLKNKLKLYEDNENR